MISVENIFINIGDKKIVKDVCFNVNKGEFFALIGPNGSGKSTIVKSLAKTLNINKGQLLINNKNINEYNNKEYAKNISTLTQHNAVLEGLTVYDRVAYGRIPHKKLFDFMNKKDHDIIENALKETDMISYRHQDISTLSGGEQQRVYLAGSFAQEPEVLILDEPTNHLDIKHQYNILSLVKKRVLKQKLTVLCVMHDINQALKFADRVAMIKNGSIEYLGKPEEVINESIIKDVFGMNSKIHINDGSRLVEFLI